MANLSNINNKFLVTTGGNVLIGQTAAVGTSIFQVTGSVNITGGTTSGLNITTSGTQDTININRAASNDNAITKYQTASADKWIVGLRNTSDDNFRFYSYGTSTDVLTINQGNGSATFAGTVIGTTARFDTLNNSANSKNLIYRNSSGAKTVVGGGPTPDKIYILDGGNVGIGASLPGAKLDVVGSGKFQPGIADGDALVTIAQTNTNAYVHAGIKINAGNTNPFYIYQSGSSNTLRFNYNSLADAGGQLVITDSGNVGIGTTSPGYTLEIAGPSTTSFAYQRTGVSANKWGFHSDNDATYWQNLTSGNLLFTLQNGGNVGIGTTSPDSLLTVSGSSLQNSNNAGIELSNSHNAQTVLLIENTTSRKYEVAVGGSANSIGNGSFYIYDGTAGAARLVIDSSGNVGIGTNSPSQDLTLYRSSGDTNFLISSNNGASQIFFGDTESDNIGKIDYDHSDNSLSLVVNAAERMRIEADGQVSLRTAGAHLMFQNTVGTAPYIANAGTGYADLTIATGGSERIRITSAGRVEVTGNVLSIDNVDEYRQDFTTTGSSTPSFDIDLKSIGASGQPFEVFVAWTHYSTAYGAGLHQAYYQRSTVQSDITLIHTYFNQTSTNGGAWSVVWLTGTEIRVQKSAGSHAGTGYGYIRVTRLKP